MKRLMIPVLIIGASLLATAASAQVYVHAGINIPVPLVPRIYIPAPPVVSYEQPYEQPYQQAEPYYNGYGGGQVIVEGPGYGYGRPRYDRHYYERFHENRYYNDYHHRDRGYYRDVRGHGRESHRRW